jgi:hypothetical protein
MIHPIALATVLALVAAPAAAQSIAFAQAPEQALGLGTGATIEAAIEAARADCVAGGAHAEDCRIASACGWAGWSVDVFVQHQEGPHWHEIFCGFDSRETAEAVGAALCDRQARPDLVECLTVQIWDQDGTEQIEW